MEVRDAVESDAGTLAEMSNSPTDAMVNIIHDRTVRVAVDSAPDEGEAVDPPSQSDADSAGIVGFVSFDAQVGTVHVTQIAGADQDVCVQLLDEPISFARGEGMAVELFVPTGEDELTAAAERAGFENVGTGPRFDAKPTAKFRLDP